jgi:hypothetical protein
LSVDSAEPLSEADILIPSLQQSEANALPGLPGTTCHARKIDGNF